MPKVIVFGSLNIDHVYSVQHFVRPGETIHPLQYESFPGGKGLNQCVAFERSGADTYLAGKIGSDGTMLLEFLERVGVNSEFVIRSDERTGCATIQVDENGQNSIILYQGANSQITEKDMDQVFRSFSAGDILVTQNETNVTARLLQKAHDYGLLVAFNPSPIDSEIDRCDLSNVSWLFINEIEGEQLTGYRQPEKITEKLLHAYPEMKIILTLGKDGVRYQDKEHTYSHGIYTMKVVDTTAAGDTFTGFFLGSVAKGEPADHALELASVASSLTVSKKGAAISIPTIQEVMQYLLKNT